MGKKGYVVFRGRNPGVYYDWDSCNEQVWGFSGASFRSYSSGREAEVAWEEKLGQVGRRSQELESPSVHRRQSPPSESSVGVKIACMSHEQCSTPAIDSPLSLTSVMARSNRFLEGVILGSAITMIITLMCRKMTWIEAGAASIKNWILPPSFAVAALNDRPLEEIVQDHSKPWMPFAYPLNLIYVPLVEGTVHWYLMVIDFSTKKVYKMDVFDSPHSLGRKHADMKVVCKVLEKVISSAEYVEEMWTPRDFSSWEFKEVQGLPNLGTCKNSGVWLLDWLEMGGAFQSNMIGVLEEDKTRMQTAVKLILGHFNELRATVEAKTRNTWTNLAI